MTAKKPKAGGEIDSWCTKCKLDLTHRIIAMVGEQVKKVECKTCGSHHLYRAPKSEKLAAEKRSKDATKPVAGTKPREDRPPRSRASAEARAARDAATMWEQAIAGQPANAFRAYSVAATFNPGELVRHPKFGDGVVAKVIDRGKVEVLFQDGTKTMAHGQ